MNHITQEQAIELARGAELDWHAGYLLDDERDNRYHALCNAAIEWYIAQQAAPKKPAECANGCPAMQVCDYCQGTGGEDAQAAPKRPVNCGTSYCSCIECVMEPNAKLVEACELVDDLIEHQFTGTSAGMNDLQYACDAVHAALDLYKKDQKMNTSQERVQKSEEIKQVPLTDEQIEDIAIGIAADDYDHDLVRRVERYHGIKEPKV